MDAEENEKVTAVDAAFLQTITHHLTSMHLDMKR
jgi:hypothetical protein